MSDGRSRMGWPAFPGPVFGRELRSAARGRWFYVLRALAAAGLAFYVARTDLLGAWIGPQDVSPRQLANMARMAFASFLMAQLVVVLAMVPLLVADSVAEERSRGTLGLILASRLSSAGIMLDKLAARSLAMLAVVASGLPVLALIGLFGGLDPTLTLTAYGGTIASGFAAASLSMLVSVHARSPVAAIVGAYAACLAWLVLPIWAVHLLTPTGAPGPLDWLRPVALTLARSSPLSFQWPAEVWGRGWGPPWFALRFREMAALDLGIGLVLLLLASWRLRPAYRAQFGGGRPRWPGWLARVAGFRGRSRPPCGDDPLAWKERYAPELAWLARLSLAVGLALVVHATVVRLQGPSLESVGGVFDEMFTYGLDVGTNGVHGGRRAGLNYLLCEDAAILFTAALVASTILAASGIAGERGRGTWSGLLGTPLDRREILRAKMWGAVRPVRALLGMMLFFYVASMAATALHPAGFLMAIAGVASFLWFAVALGTYVSLRSRNAGQAIGRSVALLAGVNLAPVVAIFPWAGHQSIGVATPVLLLYLPMSRLHFQGMAEIIRVSPGTGLFFLIPLGIVAAHAVGARLLTRASARRIERDEG